MYSIAISQPTYIPWIGYFYLLDYVDSFVFLDNVQFDKRSWQQRNKIKTTKGLEWITVPVNVKGLMSQKICDAKIKISEKFPQNHLKSIELNYRLSPFYSNYIDAIKEVYLDSIEHQSLSKLNTQLIIIISKILGIQTDIQFASNLEVLGNKSELLISICKIIKADRYVSTKGATEYLINDKNKFLNNKIKLDILNYEHPEYNQRFDNFQQNAGILDLLFNEGPNSLKIIRSGRGTITKII